METIFIQTINLHMYYVIEYMSENVPIFFIIFTFNSTQSVLEILIDSYMSVINKDYVIKKSL